MVALKYAEHQRPSGRLSFLEHRAAQGELVQCALAQLAAHNRIPLMLSAVEGLSYREIAAILGLSPEATRKRIYRAKQQFRALYTALERE